MHFFKIKNLIKFIFTNLITFSMITNSFAGDSTAQASADTMKYIVTLMNAKDYKAQDIVESFQKFDAKKAKEVEAYLKKNPDMQKVQMPKATLEDGKIVFMMEGVKTSFVIDENANMTIMSGSKKVELQYSMTVEEMMKKISTELGTGKQFSLMSFVIQDSYAIGLFGTMLGVFAAIALYGLYGQNQKDKFKEMAAYMDTVCSKIKNASNDEVDLDTIINKYNLLSVKFTQICIPAKAFSGYDKETCEESIPHIKKCFRDKVEQLKTSAINNSSMAKDYIRYDAVNDKYFSPSSSK